MFDQTTKLLTAEPKILITGAVLAFLAAILIGTKVRKALKSDRPAEKFVGPVMFAGMIWSADVVWEITSAVGFPLGVRVALCAVLEFMLGIAMLRTKARMSTHGDPGRHGSTAWLIASLMAVTAFAAGIFFDHNLAVAVFRPIIPLLLTKIWWDGVLGEDEQRRKRGSFRWTPRNLLLWMGAVEADERDVEVVNRDRLIGQMVNLHRQWSNATNDSRKARLEAKLVKLSEKADDGVIDAVRERRARSAWFKSVRIAQEPTAQELAHMAEALAHSPAQSRAPRRAPLEVPPAHRSKRPAQAANSENDPVEQAAQLVLSEQVESIRAAAKQTGAPESSVRDRIKKRREVDSSRASETAHSAHPHNGHPVTAGATQ